MQGSNEPSILATASILAPPGMQQLGARRVQVHLKPTERGRYRWFREDGTPTTVSAGTIEQAERAAQIVWSGWELEIEETRT